MDNLLFGVVVVIAPQVAYSFSEKVLPPHTTKRAATQDGVTREKTGREQNIEVQTFLKRSGLIRIQNSVLCVGSYGIFFSI